MAVAIEKRQRFHLLDGLRGLVVLSMVGYHFSYDVFVVGGRAPTWVSHPGVFLWQQSICCSFILLAGLCVNFSSKPYKRGLLLTLCGLVITGVTLVALPGERVIFGVLNFYGAALLLHSLLQRWLKGLRSALGVAVCAPLFLLARWASYAGCFSGWEGWPGWLTPVRVVLGFPQKGFWSSDYFPLIPWIFLFYLGYFLWPLLKGRRGLACRLPVLDWVGRHSLPIYMLHQPVLYGICLLWVF